MEKIVFKVSFQLMKKKHNKKKNVSPIYMRLRFTGEDRSITTGLWVDPSDWLEKKSRVKPNSYKLITINNQLAEFEEKVYEIINDLKHEETTITPSAILMRLQKKNTTPTLIKAFESRLDDMRNHLHKGYETNTIMYYETAKKKVINFLKLNYKTSDIALEKLNFDFIQRFDSFLSRVDGNSTNTIDKYITRLKAVVNDAIRCGWLKSNPFVNYRSKTEPTNRQFLTKIELERIENLDLNGNERLTLTKDLFLFMCYTGISFSDMRDLNKDSLTITLSGNTLLNFNRNKTSTACNVPLFPQAKAILDKYKDHPIALNKARLLPVISNQCLNRFLKEIAVKAEISKPLTCHIGRHTFATLSLENRVPLETVSKVLGHSSIKTTQIYGKITPGKIEQDYAAMKDMFSGKPAIKERPSNF